MRVARLTVTTHDPQFIASGVRPEPIPPPESGDTTFVWQPDPRYYQEGDVFPPTPEVLVSNDSYRGIRLADVAAVPLLWDPVSTNLMLFRTVEVTVQLEPVPEGEAAPPRLRPERRFSRELYELDWVRDHVRNREDVDRHYPARRSRDRNPDHDPNELHVVADTAHATGFHPTDLPSLEGPAIDMVILTGDGWANGIGDPGDMAAAFQEWADWRTQTGVPTVVRTVQWVREHYSGSDDPERIRAFLREAYSKWGTDYLLIGGDVEVVPARMSGGDPGSETEFPVAWYYAELDVTWGSIKIPFFGGSGGAYPDLWVGRVPARSAAEVEDCLEKVRTYDRVPGLGLPVPDDTYYTKAVLFAGLTNSGAWDGEDDEDTPPSDPQSTPWWQNGVWQSERLKKTVLDSLAFETYRLYPNLTSSKTCQIGTSYDCYKKQRDYYAAEGAPEAYFTHANILNALRNEEPSVVFHVEHSNRWVLGGISDKLDQIRPARDVCLEPLICSESQCDDWAEACFEQYLADNPQVPISREALDALSNGPNYFVGLSYGSMTGMYDGDAVAEHLLRDPDGGAVAWCGKSVSSNLYAFHDTTDMSTRFLRKALLNRQPVGVALASATGTGAAGTRNIHWSLFGDPVLRAWTSAPGALWLSSSLTQLGNPDFYDVTITVLEEDSTGAPVVGARVCLSRDDDVYAIGWTDDAGEARFPSLLVASSLVGIDVWATAESFVPAYLFIEEANQTVLDDDPVPIYEYHVLSDSMNAGLEADVFEAGDRVAVDVFVKNVAAEPASGATAALHPTARVRMKLRLDGVSAPADQVVIGGGNAHPPAGQPEFSLLLNESGIRPEREPTEPTLNGYTIWRDQETGEYVLQVDWETPYPAAAAEGTINADGGLGVSSDSLDVLDSYVESADGDTIEFTFEPDSDPDQIRFYADARDWVTMEEASSSYDTLLPNAADTTRFVFDLSRTLPPNQRIAFSFVTRVDEGEDLRTFTDFLVETAAPEVSFVLQKLESNLGGGCSCGLGKSPYRLRPTLRNRGNADADSIEVVLGWSGNDVAMCSGGDRIQMSVPEGGETTAAVGFTFCDSPTGRTLRVESLTVLRTVNGVVDTLEVVDPTTAYNPWGVAGSTYQVATLDAHPTVDGFRVQWTEPTAYGNNNNNEPIGYHVYVDSAGVQRKYTRDMLSESASAWTLGQPRRDVNGDLIDYKVGVTAVSSNRIETPIRWTGLRESSLVPRAGWPKRMPKGAAKSVLAVDLDDDGDLEVLAGGRVLAAWDPNGEAIAAADADGLLYNPLADADIDTESNLSLWGELAAADLDDDGETEIAMMFGNDKLHVVDEDGSAHWANPLSVDARSTPTLADLDQDGDLEIVVNGYGEGDLYVWHQNGSAYRNNAGRYVNLSLSEQYNYSGIAVADVDSTSPGLEIVQPLWNGELKLWKTHAGSGNPTNLWTATPCGSSPCNVSVSTPVIADFDSDDDPDVTASSSVTSRPVASFEHPTGSFGVVWRGKTGADGTYHYPYRSREPAQSPAVAELDPSGNGVPELFLGRQVVADGSTVPDKATVRASLFYKRGTLPGNDAYGRGTTLTDTIALPGRLRESQGITRGNPIVGDIDGDGRQEMIVGSNHGALFAWEFTPTSGDSFLVGREPGWPLQFSDLPCTPTIADLDQSGDTLQLIVGTEDGYVYVYDLPEMSASDLQWPTAAYDIARTGAFPNFWLESRRGPGELLAERDGRIRTGPNPFGPETAIEFRLSVTDRVDLAVFDAGGRQVRRVFGGELKAGAHRFEWNGRDDKGRRMASGVYFLRMTSAAGEQTRRLVLAR
ncbi:MAG: hypothetical protein IPK72_08190 [Candidatus Eisenbacteria bacterium]|nr:hypothetical protein [Candidatus Eisenbacteria bacterium]